MSITDDTRPPRSDHPTPVEVSAEGFEATGAGPRIAEVDVIFRPSGGAAAADPRRRRGRAAHRHLGARVAAAVAAIAVPTLLVRRVHAHHRAHGSPLFLHRLRP